MDWERVMHLHPRRSQRQRGRLDMAASVAERSFESTSASVSLSVYFR
jgi:hypothetical protein